MVLTSKRCKKHNQKALTEGGQDVRVRDVRDVNVLKKTKDLMLITSLNPTYLWCFSPDPHILVIAR